MQVKFFNPGLGFKQHKQEYMDEISRVLSAGDLILRDDVEKFEKNLAEFVGTKYAVALNSGTDALYLACKALGIKPLDVVAVPSHTFVATAQVVAQCDAHPLLFDLGELPSGENQFSIVAHIAGELSPLPEGRVIEDACQALGAVKNPTSEAQCWSFYPAKILGAFGDAGALTTNYEGIYNYVKEARNHFKTDYSKWGINSRMDNLQAAILNIKLARLPETLERRQQIAWQYLEGLKGVVMLPNEQPGRVWQDFVIRVDDRDALYDFLKEQGIETMKNEYPFPIPKGPRSLEYEAHTLRLPINEVLTDEEIAHVILKIKEFYGA